jgi:hypothetical protein
VGGDPTGFVVFHVCTVSTGNCSTGGTLVGDQNGVALVSDGVANTYTSSATSAGFTPGAVGRYCFRGDYLGSNVYNTSSDPPNTTAVNECFTVTDTTTSSSAQTWYPNDSASVSADHGATISGTLTIQLYTGNNCGATSGNAVSGQSYSSLDQTNKTTITVNSGSQTTFGVTTANSTSFSWKVVFTPDTGTFVSGSNKCETSTLTISN